MQKGISAEVLDLIWGCQLILGHVCESKNGPNIVFDATFIVDFDFVNHFSASLLLWFKFSSSHGTYSNHSTSVQLIWISPGHSGHISEF
jgi:hypothetical protein